MLDFRNHDSDKDLCCLKLILLTWVESHILIIVAADVLIDLLLSCWQLCIWVCVLIKVHKLWVFESFKQSWFIFFKINIQSNFIADIELKLSEPLLSVFKLHKNCLCDCKYVDVWIFFRLSEAYMKCIFLNDVFIFLSF